jgi:4-hydroxybenzoate polyprenyltransferase
MVKLPAFRIAAGFFDAVFLCRPVLLIPVWSFCMFGYLSGLSSRNGFSLAAAWNAQPRIALWMVVFSLSVGSVYVLNQIVDRNVDALNAGFALLIKGKAPVWHAWITAGVLSVLSIAVPLVFIPCLAIFSCAGLVIGLLYCTKPSYFTGRPILDFLSNATGYGIVSFGAGWYLAGGAFGTGFAVSALPYFLMMCAGSISSTLPDFAGDKTGGKMTTAVFLGVMPSHCLATGILVAAAIESLAIGDYVAAVCSITSLPLYIIFFFFRRSRLAMEATYKGGYLICMFVSCIVYPFIFPAALLIFAATVLYFRLRYNVFYPSLLPVSSE